MPPQPHRRAPPLQTPHHASIICSPCACTARRVPRCGAAPGGQLPALPSPGLTPESTTLLPSLPARAPATREPERGALRRGRLRMLALSVRASGHAAAAAQLPKARTPMACAPHARGEWHWLVSVFPSTTHSSLTAPCTTGAPTPRSAGTSGCMFRGACAGACQRVPCWALHQAPPAELLTGWNVAGNASW